MDDLRNKAMKGSAWMVAMKLTVNLLGICSTIVLARFLTPDDFGLVALAGSAYAYFSLLGQFGFDIRLIQLKDPDRAHYDTAWTANILVGLFIAVAMLLVARPAALFFRDPRIENIVYCFSVLSLAKGFENIGIVNFRKQLAFRGEFFYWVVPKLASVFIGVTAAIILRSYWALVIGMISAQVTSLLYSHLSQPFRPKFSLEKISDLFRFTKWILGIKLLRYVGMNGMEVIIGRLRGPDAVGLFGVASMIGYMPNTELAAPAKRALLPSFSAIASDSERLRAAFIKVFGVTLLITMPAAFGIMSISATFIAIVFGDQWSGAAPILRIMALVGLMEVVNTLAEPVLVARGALRSLVIVLTTHTTILVITALILVNKMGAVGAAYAMLASAVIAMPLYFFVAKLEIGFRPMELLRCSWRPFIAAVLMASCVVPLESAAATSSAPPIAILLGLVAAGVIVYCVALSLLWAVAGKPEFPERMLLDTVVGYLRSRGLMRSAKASQQ